MRASHFRLELYLVERRRNALHAGHCVLAKGNTGLVSAHQHRLDIGRSAKDAQQSRRKKATRRFRQHAEAVSDLVFQRSYLGDFRHVSKAPVDVELCVLRDDVFVGKIGRHVDRDLRRLQSRRSVAAKKAGNRFVEHPQVHVESDRVHETRLLGSEEIAGTAQLEILERDLVSGAELGVVLENRQAAVRIFVDRVRHEQVAARAPMRAPDASAKLIKLRQAKGIGAVHEHRVGVRHVEAGLDDHRRDEYVDLAIDEAPHDALQLPLAHLTVADANARARNDAPDVLGHSVDGLDAVVNEKDLSTAIELPGNSFVDEAIVPRLDVSEHGRAVARRSLHQSHVAQTSERQMQRSRYRRRRQGEYVGIESEPFQAFLVFDTEAMLFVDDDESELGEGNIGAEQPMRSDHDVDLARLQVAEHSRLLLWRLKTTERLHVH